MSKSKVIKVFNKFIGLKEVKLLGIRHSTHALKSRKGPLKTSYVPKIWQRPLKISSKELTM
jgi:hypothetical protein